MNKIFIYGRKFGYGGDSAAAVTVAFIFTKLPPRKPPVFAVFAPSEALFEVFPPCFSCKNHRFRMPPHPREGLPGCPERKFPSVFDCRFRAKTAPFSCRKALPGLRRGRRRHATGAPLQRNKALTADQRGPYGKPVAAKRRNDGDAPIFKPLCIKRLRNQRI